MSVYVVRSVLTPLFRARLTGLVALVHVISKALPSVTVYALLVRTGRARAWETTAEMARRRAVNCILTV